MPFRIAIGHIACNYGHMITRLLTEQIRRSPKSALVLGPRQTGKSTLFHSLVPDLVIDLADETTFLEFSSNPSELASRLARSAARTVLIDEVQRAPGLLNTVQAVLDESKRQKASLRFWLTGSSARKLRRGQANLLPGRLLTYRLGPLAAAELDYRVDTTLALQVGTLPEPYLEHALPDKHKLLRSYAGSYLREEIQAEALSRNIESFSRFLDVAAQWAGLALDFSKLANRAKIARRSAMRYFEVLEDTLVARRVSALADRPDLDLVKHPKFYFFDPGVWNGLLGNFVASADRVGLLFEHLWASQVWSSAAARDIDVRIQTLRTRGGLEVDFVVDIAEQRWLIEAKATPHPNASDVAALVRAARLFPRRTKAILVHTGTLERVIDGIAALPWQKGLQELGL